MGAAEAALGQVTAMLQPDQAPGSQQLRRLQAQLLLQLSRCGDPDAVRQSLDMLDVPNKAADSQDVSSGCRFGDATAACRPDKALQHQAAPDWHWWLSVQSAFHSGDLQKASPAQAHARHRLVSLPTCHVGNALLSGVRDTYYCLLCAIACPCRGASQMRVPSCMFRAVHVLPRWQGLTAASPHAGH